MASSEQILPETLDLLVRAALAPLASARDAWARWRSLYDINTTSWGEVRLLGAVAPRIGELEPGDDLTGRMKGIQKFLWVTSVARIDATVPAIAMLREHDIACLFLKGIARVAEDPRALAERLVRDLDVLVPHDMAGRAADLLLADGWVLTGWQLDPYREARFAAHHGWAFEREQGEIDLHHFSNSLNRLVGDDDRLWRRAREIAWRDMAVRIPNATDALVIALVHGPRFSDHANADWVVDAARLIQSAAIDWQVFADEVGERRTWAPVALALAYLSDVLETPFPDGLIASFEAATSPVLHQELQVYRQTDWPRTPEEAVAMTGGAIERALARTNGAPPVSKMTLVGTTRSPLQSGQHKSTLEVPPAVLERRLCGLQIVVTAPRMLMQSAVEVLFFIPGLPHAKQVSRSDAHGRAKFELLVPSSLLRLRQINTVRLEIYLPGHAERGDIHVDANWLIDAAL